MGFLILLLAYIVRRLLDGSVDEGLDARFRQRLARLSGAEAGREGRPTAGFVVLLSAVVLVGALDVWLSRGSLWILTWPLDLVVLIAMLGVPGWRNPLRAYGEAWRRGDASAAWYHVNHLLPAEARGLASEPRELHVLLSKRFIQVIFEHYFLVIFWYVLLGPAGAIGARLSVALRDHWPHPAGREPFSRLVYLLAWVPARLLSITFGIAGDLAGWMGGARKRLLHHTRLNASELLFESANGALSSYSLDPQRFAESHPDEWPDYGERSLRAVRDLLNRSMFVWICGLALLAIMGLFT